MKTSKVVETFIKVLNERSKVTVVDRKTPTIVNVARALGITVAETSDYVAQLSTNPKLDAVFKKFKWPQNVRSGYIFIGDQHKQHGEREGLLVVGQHVFADYIEQQDKAKKQTNVEIFLSVPEIQRKYKIMRVFEKNGISYKEPSKGENNFRWLYDEDKSLRQLLEECDLGAKLLLQPTNETRLIYRKDRWVGSPNRSAIVGVND